MPAVTETVEAAINALVHANRTRCLWFLRSDYYPTSPSGRLRVLDCIQRYGDPEAARQAADLSRRWKVLLDAGRQIVRVLPDDVMGTCVLTRRSELFKGDTDEAMRALAAAEITFHAGRLSGSFPQIVG